MCYAASADLSSVHLPMRRGQAVVPVGADFLRERVSRLIGQNDVARRVPA